jgi:RNA polymerase sigma factor (sigma-70 family)
MDERPPAATSSLCMDPNSPNDAELVEKSLAGQHAAFGQLYDRYARLAASVVAGVSGDFTAVDDMVQECFLRAFRKLGTLRDPDRFGPWIAGIARQVGRERRRTLRRDRHEFHDPQSLLADSLTVTDSQLGARDDAERIMQCVAKLGEQERLAIHAFFLQQQDVRQAAELLGLSRSGFYATVQRAVARLAMQLKSSDDERLKR